MARLSDDEVSNLKSNISLLRLAESQGHELKREGKDYVMCCPFHEEKTASMKITPEKNLFHCFGCGAGGSVIDWVMKTQGVSLKHAVELLKEDSSLAAESVVKKRTTVTKLAAPLSEDAGSQSALLDVIAFYHDTLKQTAEAQEYLKSRGLDDAELIEHFKLGYANRTLGLRLPEKNRVTGAKLRGLLQEVGILRKSGHEHFAGSLVVPVINDGKVLEVYGRKVGKALRKGTPLHLYLPNQHEGVFNLDGLGVPAKDGGNAGNAGAVGNEEVILCESLIDALTFWRWGFRSVTCSYGTSGFTDDILNCLVEKSIKRVLIAYDRDKAGNEAAEKMAKILNKQGIDAYRILFPKNMDANEYALKMSPPEKSLGLVIRKAEPMGKVVNVVDHSLVEDVAVNEIDIESTPAPSLPKLEIPMEVGENEITLTLGDRSYRVKGFDKSVVTDSLKVNLMASMHEEYHMDKLDLYSSKQRQVFVNQTSVELGVEGDVIKRDLGKVLLQLESLQQSSLKEIEPPEQTLSQSDKQAALSLLRDETLLSRILIDFENAGVVGEESNKLVGYLACVSRKLARPLAVMVQSSSAAGKSSLMDAILNLMPENERVQYSAMTGQSLFYMGETNLKHKILAISEEEGASNASYALKLLQSEGEVTIASTGKDDNTGDLVTKEYRVEGPVMLFMTTTAIDIDEELLNRCLVLSVNESREQTQAIHAAQRQSRTLAGLENKLKKEQLTTLHRNAQSLLRPLAVINPYADQLTFLDDKTRTRRDHEKYLTLIDSIALLHQYQREIKTIDHAGESVEYVEVALSDIEVANRLAHEILGRTLDELPPQTRKLLNKIWQMVDGECKTQSIEKKSLRFSRKDIRDHTGWSDGQLKIHCGRLTELEYLLVHRGGRGCSLEYELLYDGSVNENASQLMGLIDVEKLQKQQYDSEKSGLKKQMLGQESEKIVPSQGQVSPKSEQEKSRKASYSNGYTGISQGKPENTSRAL